MPEGPHGALCPVRSYQPKPGWTSMQAVSSSPFRARVLFGVFSSALGAYRPALTPVGAHDQRDPGDVGRLLHRTRRNSKGLGDALGIALQVGARVATPVSLLACETVTVGRRLREALAGEQLATALARPPTGDSRGRPRAVLHLHRDLVVGRRRSSAALWPASSSCPCRPGRCPRAPSGTARRRRPALGSTRCSAPP